MKKIEEDLMNEAQKEAAFFDKAYADAGKKQQLQNYLVPERLIRQVRNPDPRPLKDFEYAFSRLGNLQGKKLLDFGAGDGWNSICFAKAKAHVWAIDISEKGVELIRTKAVANGVSDYITAEVRNCYKTELATNQFDIIYGGGVLHHLNIDAAGKEICRILHPDGVAVFFEPIRDSRVMDVIKMIVLKLINKKPLEETENETPLTSNKIRQLESYFDTVNYTHFNVLTSAGLLINSDYLKKVLTWLDYSCMKFVPGFKKLGRAVVIELRAPKKAHCKINN